MQDLVIVERDGPVTIVTINRPAVRNAVDRPTAEQLEQAFADFESSPDQRVAILTGAGDTFCAGADLAAIGTGDGDRVNRIERSARGPMGPSRMASSKPTIAAVEGHAVAGGLELALWCDLRVVADNATFGVFCRRWGVPLIDGGTVRLPRIVGMGRALDLILTGRPVTAAEAFEIGLATRLVPAGQSLASALELANEIAAFPQTCVGVDLLSARSAFDRPLDEALLAEHDRGLKALADTEMVSGAQRFVEGAGRGGSF